MSVCIAKDGFTFYLKSLSFAASLRNFLNNNEIQIQFCLDLLGKNSKQTNIQWWLTLPGRVALAFLLGFFDGDGYYSGVKSARIYANSKQFLEHIKDLFNIKNRVCEDKTPGETLWVFDEIYISKGMYSLALGPKLFEKMLKSYNLSMQRKRPKNIG